MAAPGPREATLLAALTDEPTSTDDVYDRVGYPALVRLGLVGYHAFRDALVALERDGLVTSTSGRDGVTLWTRA